MPFSKFRLSFTHFFHSLWKVSDCAEKFHKDIARLIIIVNYFFYLFSKLSFWMRSLMLTFVTGQSKDLQPSANDEGNYTLSLLGPCCPSDSKVHLSCSIHSIVIRQPFVSILFWIPPFVRSLSLENHLVIFSVFPGFWYLVAFELNLYKFIP